MQVVESPSSSIGKGPVTTLTLRHDLMGIHNSAVEFLTVVEDVLLSSGGNDGKIFGRDKYLHRPDTGHHTLPSGRTIGGRGRRPP